MNNNTITLNGSKAYYVGNLLFSIFFFGLAVFLLVMSSMYGEEPAATILAFIFIAYGFTFAYGATKAKKLANSITFFKDDELYVMVDGMTFAAKEADIKISQEQLKGKTIFYLMLLGYLPGMFYYLFKGLYKVEIKYQNENIELRFVNYNNFAKLLTYFKSVECNDYPWVDSFTTWFEKELIRLKKMRKMLIWVFIASAIIVGARFVYQELLVNVNFNYDSGLGTESSPYVIKTKSHFSNFIKEINKGTDENKYYVLVNDIDYNGEELIPIGYNIGDELTFKGHFDGQGNVVSNFQITNEWQYSGLFAINDGTIKNLGVSDFFIDINYQSDEYQNFSNLYSGGLVGLNRGAIDNCFVVRGQISIASRLTPMVGGLVGAAIVNNISNSYAACDINVTANNTVNAGGFVGRYLSGSIVINNCLAIGDVKGQSLGDFFDIDGFTVNFRSLNNYRYEGQRIVK